jgi:hypothetical protein
VKTTGFYPRARVDASGSGVVSSAGGLLLVEAVRAAGLDRALSQVMAPWRKPLAIHDPAKIICDLAIILALGGDCLADIAKVRGQPGVYGLVASDPTVSRLIDALAEDATAALAAINAARAAARARVWGLAGDDAPDHDIHAVDPLIIDVDATLVTAHSDKQGAAATFKRGWGFHPLWAFVDHGAEGTGEPLSHLLRSGNAGSNTAADHIRVVKAALKQLPGYRPDVRPGRKILIRTDTAGCTHDFLDWITAQRMSYSVGFSLPEDFAQMLKRIPTRAWTEAVDADGEVRDGAWVTEVTDLLDLSGWPDGMRVIIRAERPHPGAQLRITDADGNRITAFATNTRRGQLAHLVLRHRRRARAEDRIRCAKRTPACATSRSTSSTRTGSGAPSSRWPATSRRGCSCSRSAVTKHGGGNPNAYDSDYSPSPPASYTPDDRPSSASPATTPGPTSSSPASADCGLSPNPADQHTHALAPPSRAAPPDHGTGAHPRRHSGTLSHPPAIIHRVITAALP